MYISLLVTGTCYREHMTFESNDVIVYSLLLVKAFVFLLCFLLSFDFICVRACLSVRLFHHVYISSFFVCMRVSFVNFIFQVCVRACVSTEFNKTAFP